MKTDASPATESPAVLRSAAARLLVGATPDDADVRLDATSVRGPQGRRAAASAAALDVYLDRHPAERDRFDAVISRAWTAAKGDRGRLAIATSELVHELTIIATVDAAARESEPAVARLRDDLAEYLATIEGLSVPVRWR